jgi:adenine phosphoribosyltransferase
MTSPELGAYLRSSIRTIADYPKPGIMFRDITTLLGDARAFRRTVDELVQPWAGSKIDKVAGIEARGFIWAGQSHTRFRLASCRSARRENCRISGSQSHIRWSMASMKWRCMRMEWRRATASSWWIDLIASGGTAEGAIKLLRQLDVEVLAACFIIDLTDLGGADKLRKLGVPVRTLVAFEGH